MHLLVKIKCWKLPWNVFLTRDIQGRHATYIRGLVDALG